MLRTSILIAALGAVPLLNGCVAVSAVGGAVAGTTGMQNRTMGESIDDSLASSSVKSRLSAVDRTGYANVDVEVAAGRLLLSGTVPTEEHRQTAELLARSSRHVTDVFNELAVGPNDRFGRTANDAMINSNIRTRLVASREVRGLDLNIVVQQGTVYLMGLARTEEEIRAAAEIASRTGGVSRVLSLMEVRAPRAAVQSAQSFSAPSAQQAATSPY